jgi:hypothetical protein
VAVSVFFFRVQPIRLILRFPLLFYHWLKLSASRCNAGLLTPDFSSFETHQRAGIRARIVQDIGSKSGIFSRVNKPAVNVNQRMRR